MTVRRTRIAIRGSGLAGVAAAKLLRDRGMDVRLGTAPQRNGRIVAIPVETLNFASSLFGFSVADLKIGTIVTGRRVDWSGDDAAVVPQIALACDAGEFAAALADRLPDRAQIFSSAGADADWTIEASGRPIGGSAGSGSRVGQFIRIASRESPSNTTVTATLRGWTFTLPHPAGGIAALIVSPSSSLAPLTPDAVAERLTADGLTVTPADIMSLGVPASIAPRLAEPVTGEHLLRIGDAALALDPLRGDGAGFALRGALLAQSVVAAVDDSGECMAVFNHYQRRLRDVFVSHLRGCSSHYRAARNCGIWRHDILAMDRLAARMQPADGDYEFRLTDRDLVPDATVRV